MKVSSIICDVGGVLVLDGDHKKLAYWEKKLHLEQGQLSREIYLKSPAKKATIGAVKSEEVWTHIQKTFALSKEELDDLISDFYFGNNVNIKFYKFMQTLRGRYKSALLSNAWLNARELYTTRYHLDKIIDVMIISAEIGMKKPSKRIFNYALEVLGSTAKETLFIDDTKENINAAKKLGMQTVYFTSTQNAIDGINQHLSQNPTSIFL